MGGTNQIILSREDNDFRCLLCEERDFQSEQSLLQHCRSQRHANAWCDDCDRLFANDNESKMHEQVHLPRTKECYGCTSTFKQDSAVFKHLETDACASGVTRQMIDEWAFECFQHKHYTNDSIAEHPYSCQTCQSNFRLISALLEHTESGACGSNQFIALDKLKWYVEKKVTRHMASESSSM